MRNLLAFIIRFRFFFIFLLLEVVAFTMIINHTFYQRYVLLSSANRLTGTVHGWSMGVGDYFSLRSANIQLAEENARLRSRLSNAKSDESFTVLSEADTLNPARFTFIPAKVISNSTNKRNNYLMLNKGSNHGIGHDMAVITAEGVVGVVINVSDNFSWVMSVLNQHARVSARLKKQNLQGSLSWDGKNYRRGLLSDVPSHIEIAHGDTIITSGYSYLFPPDIMIGTVNSFEIARGDHFYNITLDFSVDYNRLSHVYVVKNLFKEEQLEIMLEL